MSSALKAFIIICFLSVIMLHGVTTVHALVRHYSFELKRSPYTRLCSSKNMLTVNGQFPGPTIYARRGDLVIIDVVNRADQNISIHWHGVKMPRYPWSDGTNFVTQCPISPGTRFTQRMILSDEEGTLWWHAHSDWSRATVHGAIVILPPKMQTFPFPKPHAQVPIILGEWWNADLQQVMHALYATGRDPQISNAFLMNGQPGDMYPCSQRDTFKLRVEFGKTYLIRIVSAMMDYIMFFKIANHTMTVVGSDGAYTKPLKTDYVAIPPGQTVDILLEANQPPSHYYMVGKVYASGADYIPTTGILEYIGNYTPPPSPSFPSYPVFNTLAEASNFSNQFSRQLRSLANNKYPIDVPMNITKPLFFVLSMNHGPCTEGSCQDTERILASVNNVSMLLPRTTDILDAYYRGISGVYTADFPDFPAFHFNYTQVDIPREMALPNFRTAVSILEYGATVEIVLQGTNLSDGIDHPMHLHGHSFYVVGSGFGNFDARKDPANYNLVDPPLMESIGVPRNGWAVIRFKAKNPGVWYMHCHFERHQSWGMRMAFVVKDGDGPNEKMLPPPPDMPRCGKQLSSHPHLSAYSGKTHNEAV